MSEYTIVNPKAVEDMAPKFGLSPGLESRFARRALELEKSGMSYYRAARGSARRLDAGARGQTSFWMHRR